MSVAADSRASEFDKSTTQARPRDKGYACDPPAPFPDLGTDAGSCEPTTQPPTIAPEVLASTNSDGGCDSSGGGSESVIPVRRNPNRKGRAGGQATGTSVKGKNGTRATSGRPPDTLLT
jgi:hypothetical protein